MKFYTAIALFGATTAIKLREETEEELDVVDFYVEAEALCKEYGLTDESGEVPADDLAWHLDEASKLIDDDGVVTLDEAAEYMAREVMKLDSDYDSETDSDSEAEEEKQ